MNEILKKWSKRLVMFVVGLVLLFFILYYIPIQHHIDRTETGVLLRFGNPEYEEIVSINIQGTYKMFLLKPDEYIGRFSIDKYVFTTENAYANIVFKYHTMVYSKVSDEDYIMRPYTLGTIISSSKLDSYIIQISEPIEGEYRSWNGMDGLILVAPAQNKEEAIALANEVYRKHDKNIKMDISKGLYYILD